MDVNIRSATVQDIPGIIAILAENLMANKIHPNVADLEESGFLLHGFSAKDIEDSLRNADHEFIFVLTQDEEIVGYTIGYSFQKKSTDLSSMNVALDVLDTLKLEQVFFHKHIAKKLSVPGVGPKLLSAIIEFAKIKNFTAIACLIAHAPLENKRSRILHEHFGFNLLGLATENNKTYGVYLKKF